MRLSCFDLGIDIHFYENIVNVLVIENQEIFTLFLEKLMSQEDDEAGILLSEEETKLPIGKWVEIIHSPFFLDLNSKKILSHLYQEIKVISDTEFTEEVENINSAIVSYLDHLLLKVPYPITFNLELDVLAMFKQYEVRMEQNQLPLCERLLNYMQLIQLLCGVKLIVLVNIKSYLSNAQLQEIYKTAFYNKIQLLLLESSEKDVLSEEKYCIIDKDKCVIEH